MSRQYNEVLEARILAREQELDAMQGNYQRAKVLNCETNSVEDLKLYKLALSYKAGDVPEKAVYILAQLTTLLGGLVAPALVVEAFEAKQRTISELRAGRSVPEAS